MANVNYESMGGSGSANEEKAADAVRWVLENREQFEDAITITRELAAAAAEHLGDDWDVDAVMACCDSYTWHWEV